MSYIGEATEFRFEDYHLFIGAGDIVGAIAQLTSRTPCGPGYDEGVVLAVVLDYAAAFVQTCFCRVVGYGYRVYTTGFHSAEIGFELAKTDIAAAVEHVGAAIVVEKQRGVVEVVGAAHEIPFPGRVGGGVDV